MKRGKLWTSSGIGSGTLILPTDAALLPMNELAVNLSAKRVDHGYLQFLVVSQAAIAHVLCKLFAVLNRLSVARELNADAVPHRNAVFHIEEELLHGWSILGCVGCHPSLTSK
jgi:hypothetical protein